MKHKNRENRYIIRLRRITERCVKMLCAKKKYEKKYARIIFRTLGILKFTDRFKKKNIPANYFELPTLHIPSIFTRRSLVSFQRLIIADPYRITPPPATLLHVS